MIPIMKSRRTSPGTFAGNLKKLKSYFRNCAFSKWHDSLRAAFRILWHTDVGTIAILHLDGDWYASTKCCFDNLYDKVSPGGLIQIDDWGYWAGARKATTEFLGARGIEARLTYIDESGRQLFKEPAK